MARLRTWPVLLALCLGCGKGSGGSGGGTCAGGPRSAPISGCAPTPVPNTGDFHADCVARVNQLRGECQCLPALERWTAGEACADQEAQYDHDQNSAHAGFSAGICDPGGSAQNECPGWDQNGILGQCLQGMWDEGPGQPYAQHGHYINLSNPDYTRVACGEYVAPDGSTWALINFQ
jgi:hypothetical protein